MSAVPARSRPLQVRPGMAYACHGDGLCCTDVHVLGPLGRREAQALRRAYPDVVRRSEEVAGPALRTTDEGACVFLGEGRCELHAALGAAAKPSFCRRFPLFLTATPHGGRVGLVHRCPCRTLGARPPLAAEAAAADLVDARGRLLPDHRVEGEITVGRRARASFDDWVAFETRYLARLDAGEPLEAVLAREPFPPLARKGRWRGLEAELVRDAAGDRTRFGAAMAWFARGLARARGRLDPAAPAPPRPWRGPFDRAEQRPGPVRAPDDLFRDWIADHVWGLAWAAEGSFLRCRQDLATRLAVGRAIAACLEDAGARPDRAAAEAIAVVELIGVCEWWTEVLDALG